MAERLSQPERLESSLTTESLDFFLGGLGKVDNRWIGVESDFREWRRERRTKLWGLKVVSDG